MTSLPLKFKSLAILFVGAAAVAILVDIFGAKMSGARAVMTQSTGTAQQKNQQAVRLGVTNVSYLDPEILSPIGKVTFQDQAGNIWVGDLDPVTGNLVSETGKDYLIDSSGFPLRETFNGPEFGLDKNGWAVYYTKAHQGTPQIWRAVWQGGKSGAEPVTTGPLRHQTALVSKNPAALSTQVICVRGSLREGTFIWFDLKQPTVEHDLASFKSGEALRHSPRWVDDGAELVFTHYGDSQHGQLALFDSRTGKTKIITNDAGVKSYPYAWYAPEHKGALLALALVDYEHIAVYIDKGGKHWERIATLSVPKESRMKYVRSAEPFTAGGKSYISLVIKDESAGGTPRPGERAEAEVWVFGIADHPKNRFAIRCDDGQPGARRSDPEVFTGRNEVFVYYTTYTAAGAEFWRCRTGIKP